MFGKMNIDKALKFYLQHPKVSLFTEVAKNHSTSDFLAEQWEGFDERVHQDFRKKYRLELGVDQRWFIFLAILQKRNKVIDQSLADYFRSCTNRIAFWAASARMTLHQQENFDFSNETLLFKGFPYMPLFSHALQNTDVVFQNLEKAHELVSVLQSRKDIKSLEDASNWYRKLYGFLIVNPKN